MTIELSPTDVRALCGGAIALPGDDAYEAGRGAWNAAIDQRPALIAYPASPDEVAGVMRYARDAGLRVAPQGTGHNAGPLGDLSDAVLLRTSAMTEVTIDPDRRIARVGAGVLWEDVVDAAAPFGLYALHGSSPDVGVVGYSLGGGMGWVARKHGLATNSLTAVEIVTADGEIVRTDADNEPDLFWALRGGGGNFGVVTAVEFKLYPIASAYAGMLVWDWTESHRVLTAWVDWTRTAPDEVTTSIRIMQLPDLEMVPEPLRGRSVIMIDGAVIGDPDAAVEIMAPLRALEPEMDMWATMPAAALVRIHGDPEEPTPVVSDTAMLDDLDAEAIAALVAAAGPGSGSTLGMVELRQLGGALGRVEPGSGALTHFNGSYIMFAGAFAPDPDVAALGHADAVRVAARMQPWSTGSQYLNFVEYATDTSVAYTDEAYARLQAVRAAYDPHRRMAANHPIH
jgi:FAD/FMN-containing dehydrogenase